MKRKPYYECPLCHAHLDCGERCDCQEELAREQEIKRKAAEHTERLLTKETATGQLVFSWKVGA